MTETRARVIVAIVLFISYAYFYQAGGWNQNSRFALVRAILERHTLQIDAYAAHTGDIALKDGHYYSDKAPGASLASIVPVAAARVVSRAAGVDPESFPGIAWTSYVATVATSGVFTVVAAIAIMWIAAEWGYSTSAGVFAATAYGVATPAWCYATLFMGHSLAAGCLMIAFAAAIALSRSDARRARMLGWTIGLTCGWAVVTEFPAAVPVMLIVALAALNTRDAIPDAVAGTVARIIGGGAIMAAVLASYNVAAFGSPLHIGYASERGFEQMRAGLFGITYPQLWRVRELLIGSYRGLLPIAPLMALTPVGIAYIWMSGRGTGGSARRRAAFVAAAIPVFYLLLNASYYYWEGGWAYGPRQITAALPFACIGFAPLWDRWRGAARIILYAGWVWGAAVTLVAVATTPQPPSNFRSPVTELLWPAFKNGDLSLNNQTMVHFAAVPDRMRGPDRTRAAWNLGEIIGLHGLASLIPLALVWIVAAGFALTLQRQGHYGHKGELRAEN